MVKDLHLVSDLISDAKQVSIPLLALRTIPYFIIPAPYFNC